MPMPLIKISDAVQKAAYDDLAKGAMRQFGDAAAVMVERVLNLRYKSHEERALDWQHGAEEGENRRRLAAEALDLIPPERRMFPARQIAGPIFRDSEFELPETPIWEMWKQLLARACDRERLSEAHPSFIYTIRQISSLEAEYLRLLDSDPSRGDFTLVASNDEMGDDELILLPHGTFFHKIGVRNFGVANLQRLGLIGIVTSFEAAVEEEGWVKLPPIDTPLGEVRKRLEMSQYGHSFMKAVSSQAVG